MTSPRSMHPAAPNPGRSDEAPGPRVGLFATCLMNLFRPQLGHATVSLLERAGCSVDVPLTQTCCGQPSGNSGDDDSARELARANIALFEAYDYVVAPSGSCIATLRDYPRLFSAEPAWHARAEALAARAWELLSFLHQVRGYRPEGLRSVALVTYHDSCSGLRKLGVKAQPRALLAAIEGLQLSEMSDAEVCCGFGGSFCVKYPDISEKMVDDKIRAIEASGADTLLGGDLGCLLNIAGRLSRREIPVRVLHTAELLAGNPGPGLGQASGEDRHGRD